MVEYQFADFKTAGGTVPATVALGSATVGETRHSLWTRSPEARPYEGLWVLLSPSLAVLDRDLSPSALKSRHPDPDGNAIVFVPQTMVRLAG